MSQAPIDRLRFEPVPGKEGTFLMFDKETGEPFSVAAEIEKQYAAGQCRGK